MSSASLSSQGELQLGHCPSWPWFIFPQRGFYAFERVFLLVVGFSPLVSMFLGCVGCLGRPSCVSGWLFSTLGCIGHLFCDVKLRGQPCPTEASAVLGCLRLFGLAWLLKLPGMPCFLGCL